MAVDPEFFNSAGDDGLPASSNIPVCSFEKSNKSNEVTLGWVYVLHPDGVLDKNPAVVPACEHLGISVPAVLPEPVQLVQPDHPAEGAGLPDLLHLHGLLPDPVLLDRPAVLHADNRVVPDNLHHQRAAQTAGERDHSLAHQGEQDEHF